MKRIYNLYFIFILLSLLLGCSSEKKDTSSSSKELSAIIYPDDYPYYKFKTPVSLKDSIEVMLNAAIERQRYNDKSGMYEMEFGYLTDQITLDQYIRDKLIMRDKVELINKVEVLDVHRFNNDSASTNVMVFVKNSKGEVIQSEQQIIVYNYRGQWIRPTLSKVESELKYQNVLRNSIEKMKEGAK